MPRFTTPRLILVWIQVLSAWVLILGIVMSWWIGSKQIAGPWLVATFLSGTLIASVRTRWILLSGALLIGLAMLVSTSWQSSIPDILKLGLVVGGWGLVITISTALVARWQSPGKGPAPLN